MCIYDLVSYLVTKYIYLIIICGNNYFEDQGVVPNVSWSAIEIIVV